MHTKGLQDLFLSQMGYIYKISLSPPDSSVSLEYVHPNDGGTFQLTVEASERLTACSCASPSSMSKTNTLAGTCPSKKILELGGTASTGVEETADIPINEMTATAEAYRHISPGAITAENEEKDMDAKLGLKRTKGDSYNLMIRNACANTQVALVNLTAGCQRDQQFHVVSKHTKHEPSRTKNTYHTMNPDFPQRNTREKNAYAVSVLKRMRTKLEGRDINGNRYAFLRVDSGSYRQIAVAEHVDHLLRQATSIDNLCNMFEGWTPWI